MRGNFANRPLYQPACINLPASTSLPQPANTASPTIKTASAVNSAQGQDT
jgi:hypothetical protein